MMSDASASDALDSRIHRFSHDAMACTFELYIVRTDRRAAQRAAQSAFDEIDRVERVLSRFIPHSDVGRINALEPGRAIRIAPETAECLAIADALHRATGGAFDVAFRSAPATSPRDAPAPALVFDPTAHAISVSRPGVRLDLGGVGKGCAVDRVVAVLQERGIGGALVHAGQSTAFALGGEPSEPPWRLALRHPEDADRILGFIRLRDAAFSGSACTPDKPHILDPRTMEPAACVRAAWSIAPSAAVADGLSTALMVVGVRGAPVVVGRFGGASGILLPDGGGASSLVFVGPSADVFEAHTEPQ